jgi:hypothetical protein
MLRAKVFRKNFAPGRKLVSRIYDTVHVGLWSGLAAFVIFFCLFVLPQVPQSRAKAEAARILELQAENHAYCEKWGFPRGGRKHEECVLDLQALRTKIDQRALDDVFP